MSNFSHLKAYNGSKPYIFISYAHADSARVLPVVEAMQNQGFRIWFDMGIEAGTEWSNNIAKHLRECNAFLFFASKNSVASENCLDEVAYAKSHLKPSLMIFLEENVILPEGTEMQTARFQRMFLNRHKTMEGAVEKIAEAPILIPCRDEMSAFLDPTPLPKAPKLYVPSKNKPKKNLGLWIGLGAGTLALVGIILLIVLLGGNSTSSDKGPGQNNTNPILQTTPNEPGTLTLSGNLADFTFLLMEKVYQLPAELETFTEKGWELDIQESDKLGGLAYKEVTATMGENAMKLELFNPSGNARELTQCVVSGISAYPMDCPGFAVSKLFTGASRTSEILESFGTPEQRYDNEDTSVLEYAFGDNRVVFHTSENPDEYPYAHYIKMYRRDIQSEKTETSTQRPEYLDAYVAPEALGDDLKSGFFELEGVVYAMPAPVSAYLENGWTIGSGPGHVPAYGKGSISLQKGNMSVDMEIRNNSDLQALPENCQVTMLTVFENENASLKLPNGLSFQSSSQEAKDAMTPYCEEDSIHKFDGETTYWASLDNNVRLIVSVNETDDLVYIIDIRC